nr:MAG TPA: hypothetical protein [Bacteriophage sp.]
MSQQECRQMSRQPRDLSLPDRELLLEISNLK